MADSPASSPLPVVLSPDGRHGMRNSRFPVEVCERIIDACHKGDDNYYNLSQSYRTWRQTALVCYDWLPRTRVNLFRVIKIQYASQGDLLLRTLSEAPRLGELILEVYLRDRDQNKYFPFAQLFRPPGLINCTFVSLYDVDWRFFPPRYLDNNLIPLWTPRITHV